jgi:hypothetical protein
MILQTRLPYDIDAAGPLPGIRPLGSEPWLLVDEAYGGQMAERRRLLAERRDEVLAMSPDALPATQEALRTVLDALPDGFTVTEGTVVCPDGACIPCDDKDPLGTLGRIVQEDICLMQKHGDQHVLTGAVLCFPASWRLDEKYLRPLTAIHDPVDSYDPNIARRVQRLFDGVRAGHPLWRFNALAYEASALFNPRSMDEPHTRADPATARFIRSERQCLVRLPVTRAVVFSIHTYVLSRAAFRAGTAHKACPSVR